MLDENRQEEKKMDAQLEDESILGDIAVGEEDFRHFPPEMVLLEPLQKKYTKIFTKRS